MHLIITDARLARSRAIHLSGTRLLLAGLALSLCLMLVAATLYHWVFLEGVRQGWPGFGSVARLVTQGELDSKELYMRENLDAMARKLGEMQGRMVQIESLGARVAGLAGISPQEFRLPAGSGGALVGSRELTVEELMGAMEQLDRNTGSRVDWLTVVESRLFDQKILRTMVPTEEPVKRGQVGSPFGFRIDPFTGRSALHTGLDFPGDVGTPIYAAAGGVVVVQEYHPAYGNMVEVSHQDGFVTSYAHLKTIFVKPGQFIRREETLGTLGNTGRSTGPHLHYEVLLRGQPMHPAKALAAWSRHSVQ